MISAEATKANFILAMLCIRHPHLEGRCRVVVRKSPHGALYRAQRIGPTAQSGAVRGLSDMPRVKLTFMADFKRRDFRQILDRAAEAAYKVATNAVSADALMEYDQ